MGKCEYWQTWRGKDPRDDNKEYCPVLKFNTRCGGLDCKSSPEAITKYVRYINPKPITPKP